MEIYRVSFIGHREVDNLREIEEKLTNILSELIRSKEFVEFQIGRNGEFDEYAASCVKRVQKQYGNHNSSMTLILPYPYADIPYYEKYYDNIYIPEEAEKSHPKSAITKRNKWLVDNSDLLIAYVHRNNGGAYDTVQYALKNGTQIIKI